MNYLDLAVYNWALIEIDTDSGLDFTYLVVDTNALSTIKNRIRDTVPIWIAKSHFLKTRNT